MSNAFVVNKTSKFWRNQDGKWLMLGAEPLTVKFIDQPIDATPLSSIDMLPKHLQNQLSAHSMTPFVAETCQTMRFTAPLPPVEGCFPITITYRDREEKVSSIVTDDLPAYQDTVNCIAINQGQVIHAITVKGKPVTNLLLGL